MSKKGAQVRTTCEYCGRTLSAQALGRHVWTSKCMEEYWRRRLDGQYSRPRGTLPLDKSEEEIVFRICREAGVTPDRAPVHRQVVWERNPRYPEYTPSPIVETLVPMWLGIVVKPLCLHTMHQWVPGEGPRLLAQRRILEQDVITLLHYFDDRPDEAMALSTELDLVAAEVGRNGGRFYELDRVAEVLRRWASEVTTRATLDE